MASNSLAFEFLAKDKASKTFDKLVGKSDTLGAKLGKFAKAAAVAGAAATGVFAVKGVKAFMALDDSMNKSLAIMGKVTGPMRQQMESAARAVGKTTRFSASEAAESYFFLASAGMDAAASVKAMPQVAKFATAGMFDLSTATDLATDAQSALGLTSDNAGKNLKNLTRVTDTLVKANTLANASVEQFSSSLTRKAGASLKAVNKDIEEGVAALAVFADQGVKGELAGTMLSSTLDGLAQAALKNKDKFDKLGISVFDSAGNMRNLSDISADLEQGLGKMSDKQKLATLRALGFNKQALDGIRLLMGNADALSNYEKKLRNAAGTTDEVSNKQLQSFAAKWDLLKSKVEDFAITVGEPLVRGMFALGDRLSPAVDVVGSWIREQVVPRATAAWSKAKQWGPKLVEVVKADVLPKVGKAWAAASEWAQPMIDSVRKGLDTGNWAPLGRSVVDALMEAVKGAADLGGKFAEWFKSINWIDIGKKVGATLFPFALGLVSGVFDGITDTIINHPWETLLTVAFATPIGRAFKGLGKLLEKLPLVRIFAPLFNGIGKIFAGIGKFFDPAIKAVAGFFKKLGQRFFRGLFGVEGTQILKNYSKWLGELPTRIGLAAIWVRDAVAKLFGKMGDKILSFAEKVGGWIRSVIGWLTKPFRSAGSWLLGRAREFVGGLGSGIVQRARDVGSWVKSNIIDRAVSPFKSAGRWLKSAGGDLIGGLKDGIVNTIRNIGSWIKSNIVDPIINAVKSFFGIASPSKVFAGIGGHLISGLIKGMAKTNGVAIAKKIFGDMPKALGAIAAKGLVSLVNLPAKAMKALGGMGSKLLGMLGIGGGGGGGHAANMALGQTLAAGRGWVGAQWEALKALWMGESGWNHMAQNPTSTAFGIAQFLDSTWSGVGARKTTDPAGQILAGMQYIAQRYGSPLNALRFWQSQSPHWYDTGGILQSGKTAANKSGKPEWVLSPRQTSAFERLVDALTGRVKPSDDPLKRQLRQMHRVLTSLAKLLRDVDKHGLAGRVGVDFRARMVRLMKRRERVDDRLEKALARRDRIVGRRRDLVQSLRGGIMEGRNLVGGFGIDHDGSFSAGDIAGGLTANLQQARRFQRLLRRMRRKGFARGIIAQVAAAGPAEGMQTAQALVDAQGTQVKQINKTFGAIGKTAGKFSTEIGDKLFGAGVRAARGLVKGLRSRMKHIQRAMNGIARALVKAIKRALDMRSPSRVMEKLGELTGDGFTGGLAKSLPKAIQTMGVIGSDLAKRPILRRESLAHGGGATVVNNYNITLHAPNYVGSQRELEQAFRRSLRNNATLRREIASATK